MAQLFNCTFYYLIHLPLRLGVIFAMFLGKKKKTGVIVCVKLPVKG